MDLLYYANITDLQTNSNSQDCKDYKDFPLLQHLLLPHRPLSLLILATKVQVDSRRQVSHKAHINRAHFLSDHHHWARPKLSRLNHRLLQTPIYTITRPGNIIPPPRNRVEDLGDILTQ